MILQSPITAPFAEHELAAWRGMLELHADVSHQLDAQMRADHGLTLSAYELLICLDDVPAHRMRMAEIAQRVLLSPSGATRLVDRLADLGYVSRRADSSDGRGLHAELTPAGQEKIEVARLTHREGVRRLYLDHLTTTDQIALGDIWGRFQTSRAGS
jgi:DNA-binding MarR family transcriptional regulator